MVMINPQNYIRESAKGYQSLRVNDIQYTNNRIIYFTGEVNAVTSQELISKLLYLDSLSNEPVTLVLNSPGGDVFSGYSVIDVIDSMKSPVNTVCAGLCASMASFIFVSGAHRTILKSSRLLVHDAAAQSIDGRLTASALSQEVGLLKKLHDDNKKLLLKRTSITPKEAEKMLSGDTWILAEEALNKGFADDILADASVIGIRENT